MSGPLKLIKNLFLFIAEKLQDFVETKYRWIVIIPIVLPLSFIFNIYAHFRNMLVFYFKSSPKRHAAKVQKVVEQVKQSKDQKMCTGRSVYDTMSLYHALYKKNFRKIDLSHFIDVLDVDTKRQVVRVEPLVTCGQLTQTLLPQGWTPAVLPELDELTVGGLIMGFGIETSSHKYGLFQHICVSYEIVLPDGKVVNCSETENSDLFYAIPWSHGTLGFLLSAEIRIVPAKKYAAITYEPYSSRKTLIDRFENASRTDEYDFVECLMYGNEHGIVMTGKLTDKAESGRVHHLGRWYGPWFYKHVETFFHKGKST